MASLLLMVYIVLCFQCDKGSGQLKCQPCQCCKDNLCDPFTFYCRSGCKDGFWGDRCYNQCPENCRVCSSNKVCSLCKDGFYNDYSSSNCILNCQNCKSCTSYTDCTSCKDGYYNGYDGYYDKYYGNCILPCPYNCKSCTSYTYCTSCKDGYYNGHYGGYYYGDCRLKCSNNCISCTSYYECSSCTDGYYNGISNGYRLNDCSLGCNSRCKSCTPLNNCNSCADGYYGQSCQLNCNLGCNGNVCNQTDGHCNCLSTSYWGKSCENSCSNGCVSQTCRQDSGKCMYGCKEGYEGEWCDICVSGFSKIDERCTNCSDNCAVCSEGLCLKCKYTYGGVACQTVCPERCRSCGPEKICTECLDGYFDQSCSSTCLKGQWGNQCSRVCPSNCLNSECHHINGSCTMGCKEGYAGETCDCPSNCEECDAVGSCSSCKIGFSNIDKKCLCTKDICADETCTRCSNNSFYVYNGACCQCSNNCKDDICISAENCLHGCKSGYYGYDCSNKCADEDQWCEECPINFGQTNRGCLQCKHGYYPFMDAAYGYSRCEECPNTCLESECDGANGECFKGCVDKKWGMTCQKDCPINCVKCDRSNGNCSVCEGGKYLADCSQSCSVSCGITDGNLLCAKEDGACLNGCANLNIYGEHCEQYCSNRCNENVCSWKTGDCVKGCQNNLWGKQCEHVCSPNCISIDGATSCNETNGHCLAGCIDGYHSVQCEKSCSINCLNTSCDARGRCVYGCSGDFVDDSCLQVKFEQMQGIVGSAATIGGIVGGVVVLVIIIAAVITVVLIKRRHRKDESSTKKENHHSNNAVRFSEVAERGRQTDILDSVPVYATPDKSKIKKDRTQSHTVNNPNYQKPSVALKQSVVGKVAAVYENAALREVEDSKPESDTSLSHENLTRASKTRQSLGKYLQELEDPDDNAGSSSAALFLETSGSHVKESEAGDTYYNTAEVFKRKIPLDKLAEFVDNKTRECFEEEFKLLPEGLIKKYIESQKKDNITKNRYRGIYPYDDTRVVLRDGESDYINASYIDGYKKLKAYIASLGPTYKYMDDMSAFWRMVWQEKCGKIIMLTNLMEGGTRKCDQYWPEKDSSQLYADINVTCLSEETYADYTVRVFNIQKDSAKRTVTQVHFTAWPDQGVPDDVTCLIEFRHRVVSVKTNLDGPILVHCSAGIGRTGTYIALDSLTKEGESEGSVDIYACVRNMREQRVNMIQTAEQYEYLHRAVVHSLTFDSHAIHLNHFQQYMKSHDIKTLAQKFQDLEHSVEKRSKDENEAIKKNSAIKEKNRVGADIPGDRNRPRLYLILKPEASDYINALYVNSYRHVNRFLLAQTPLPGTVDDFLTLIVQEKCSCIVSIEPETNKSKDVGIYYPADNQTLKRGSFTVRTERVSSSQNFTHRRLTISNHGKAGNEDHTVQHFQLTPWVDGMKCPEDAASFLDFLHHVELKSGGADAGPVLVHCLTGAEKCGLFCVVSILLEKLQCDQEVSVVNTVRQVKSRRHRVIPNQEQFIFCHQCVNEYIRSFENYSNFASRQ